MFEGFENHRNDCKGVKINCMVGGAGSPVLLLQDSRRIFTCGRRLLAEYRRSWNTRNAFHGFCADYRAAATVDMELDTADILQGFLGSVRQ